MSKYVTISIALLVGFWYIFHLKESRDEAIREKKVTERNIKNKQISQNANNKIKKITKRFKKDKNETLFNDNANNGYFDDEWLWDN